VLHGAYLLSWNITSSLKVSAFMLDVICENCDIVPSQTFMGASIAPCFFYLYEEISEIGPPLWPKQRPITALPLEKELQLFSFLFVFMFFFDTNDKNGPILKEKKSLGQLGDKKWSAKVLYKLSYNCVQHFCKFAHTK
jgi:hypothetical protein